MLASLYQNITGYFSLKRRRISDSQEEPPVKLARYKMDFPANEDKADGHGKENDEVQVLAEIKSPGWISPRRSNRPSKFAETSTPLLPVKSSPSTRARRIVELARVKRGNDEIEVLHSIRNVPIERTNCPSRSVPERIFGLFKSPKRNLTINMKKKPAYDTQNCIRFLQEKMTYKKLLEFHARPTMLPIKPASPVEKKAIPVIDLETDLKMVRVNRDREASGSSSSLRALERSSNDISVMADFQKPTSTQHRAKKYLRDFMRDNPSILSDTDVQNLLKDHETKLKEKRRLAQLEEGRLAALSAHNEKTSSDALEERLRVYMKITEPPILTVEEEEHLLPPLTAEQEARVASAFKSSGPEILADKFDIQISRRDIATLKGLEWLNDAVINFYMSLIIERSKRQTSLPKVYAFNTFFHFNVTNKRFSILRRWTRKFDLFDHDMILAPVHLSVHWCMSVVDFRVKEIRYYDSMGSPNSSWLTGFMDYLDYEHKDKKKTPFDRTGWKYINVADIPQQMNGADCGVFACMFAEHLARDAPLKFSQDDMPYFRRKMVTEILEGQLIT